MNPADAGGRSRPCIGPLALFLQCFALVGFAVAQPLYDLLGPNPTFFVAHHATALDIVALVLVASFVLPAVLWILLFGIGRPAPQAAHWTWLLLAGLLATLVLLPPLQDVAPYRPRLVLLVAVLSGALFATACHLFAFVRQFLAVLSLAALVFPVAFLASQPVRQLLSGPESELAVGGNNGTPVVMMVFDELPLTALMSAAGTIDRERYPNFAALADTAHWFRQASTVSHFTDISVPAILSGRYPVEQDRSSGAPAPVPANYPRNLFSLLGQTHVVRAFESVTALAPPGSGDSLLFALDGHQRQALFWLDSVIAWANLVTPAGICPSLPDLNGQWLDFAGLMGHWTQDDVSRVRSPDGRARQVERFIAAIEASDTPSVHFLHVLLPHVPLVFLPSGRYYGPQPTLPHGMGRSRWGDDPWEAQQGYQRFLLQVGYVDQLLGRIVSKLRETGLFDRALVVVTSDHGESYREGTPPRRISEENLADTLLVPLLLKLPGQSAGAVIDRSVQSIDILPTIAAVLDSAPGWEFDGADLLADSTHVATRRVFDGSGEWLDLPAEVPGVAAAIRRKQSLFGTGSWDALYHIGPAQELLGQDLAYLSVGEPAPFETVLERAVEYRAHRSDDPELPAYVRGRISGPVPPERLTLAIALNGIIAATTLGFEEAGGTTGFTAMLPEHLFRDGHNRVDVLHLVVKSNGPVLHPVPQAQRDVTVRLGQELAFGRDGFDPRYLLGGLSRPEKEHSWSNGRAVRFEFAIADTPGDVILRARLYPFLREEIIPVQTVEVLANGELLDTWVLDRPVQSEHSTIVPARHLEGGSFLLEFRLPQAVVPRHLGLGDDRRMLGVSFLSLSFADAAEDSGKNIPAPGQP